MSVVNEMYSKGYMDGYTAAMERAKEESAVPYIDLEGVMKRFNVPIGKAREIIHGVRHVCGGGKLGLTTKVLMSEMLYWESIVDKEYIARL